MDIKDLTETLLSLIILLFVLAGLRKAIIFLAGRYNITGVSTFLQ